MTFQPPPEADPEAEAPRFMWEHPEEMIISAGPVVPPPTVEEPDDAGK